MYGPCRLLTERSGPLTKLSIVVAFSLAACSSGQQGSSTTGSTAALLGSSSNGGGASSSTGTGGSVQASTGGSGRGGFVSGSGSGSGSTTGAFDAGCSIGSPGGLETGSFCLFPFDCDCGLRCAPDLSGATANLVCQTPCAADSDCPLYGEECQTDAGLCLGGLSGYCISSTADLEFYPCGTNGECPCPYECYVDPALVAAVGPVCEHPCNARGSANGECHDHTYCHQETGSCELICSPTGTTLTEFMGCVNATDCLCPYSCFGDARRGRVCETPCTTDQDCAAAGEFCEGDAGACQPSFDCYGGDGGLSPFSPCSHLADCACPYECAADPALTPPGAPEPVKLCERCDAGACESVSGKCKPPQVPGTFQASDIFACTSDDDCTCPNRCTSSVANAVLRCEQECNDSSDCNDPGQFCVGGQCVDNTCPAPVACDLANGQDANLDGGIGTCFTSQPLNDMICHSGGTADAGCDPLASRSDVANVCQTGLACAADSDGGAFHCVAACASGSDCLGGDQCISSLGICLPLNDAGTCFQGGTPVQFQACYPTYGFVCGCAYDCVANVCEQPCKRDSDCIDRTELCLGTLEQSYCLPPTAD